ncbi:MAG: Valine-tRNA ligase [Parcubacteria group bacterium GW2011_GWA2_42_80]|uniref:Valine--tRNA ligase n=1 Tax=Candidatus Veblenbacteria bacterium RIFOXYC2_FULL_42_11 TaxID=1802428 RepID=A0A1G2Q6G0_9BACT|nr:MAG: Valine-tRNA ligase [Parcubacteria group bacterium GW2011_GWA2_42_80]OHA56133.1 MAG: valine--tRNA ligase [Candidatus Veblenbacteria bacterium RIFOXYC2_FULL_42_11]
MPELPKAYLPQNYETQIYRQWEQSGFFNPDNLLKKGEPFSISLPPPNATGILHLGHAVMIAIQDLMIRYWRLRGRAALWLPGEDHAAIATQNVVEKKLHKKDGKNRYDYGRDEFIKRVNEFIASSRSTIRDQIKAMGASCDWSRERYTLDEGLSRAVREVFVRMYHDGLIYRGKRIVNWCYRCGTTLADDEVEYKEQKTPFYYLKYGPITISTARPETKVLDKVIIVHPDDKRYQGYIGKSFDVPWIDGMVKATVVADKVAEMETGTGAMTITPAHSFVDFELAQKYGFEIVDIIGPDGKLTANAGKFAGLNVKEARIAILDELKKKDLVEKIDEEYIHNLSICYRCGTPVEPLPSEQWFVAVDKPFKRGLFHRTTLKKLAIAAVSTGKIKIVPERFAKIYDHWMKNLHDWCISRQIWFGHRVPAWKCISCGEWFVGQAKPSTCLKCKASNLEQDPDTLDTWFSSSLWTFSTLGWPDKTKDLATYHPTSVMETGYDILFFWIARMVLMTQYSLGDIPFRTVYLHGLVRDKQGRKMSKSLGNGIDPIAMIDKYGADALRLSMIIGTTPGNDFRLYDEKIAGYRNFVNKLWNIVRFANLTAELKIVEIPPEAKTLADKWILSRFARVADLVTKKIESYSFSEAGEALYEFTWHELADWYLEVAKIEGNKQKILSYLITQLLKLWHPFTPYVTETLWRETFGEAAGLLMVQSWPEKLPAPADDPGFEIIRDVVTALRGFRVEHKLGPDKVINFAVTKDKYRIIESYTHLVQGLRTTTIAKPINQLSNGERLVVREGVELIVSFDKLDK